EFLGTLQPNGLVQRGSVSTLPERRTGHRDIARDSGSMEGPPECQSGGLWTGCLDYGKDHDHLWSAMGVCQRTGFRPTRPEWAFRPYPGVRRYSPADLEDILAAHCRGL